MQLQAQIRSRWEAFLCATGLPPRLDDMIQCGRFSWPDGLGPADAQHPLFRVRRLLEMATGSQDLAQPGTTRATIAIRCGLQVFLNTPC
jgi:hypothetical protein